MHFQYFTIIFTLITAVLSAYPSRPIPTYASSDAPTEAKYVSIQPLNVNTTEKLKKREVESYTSIIAPSTPISIAYASNTPAANLTVNDTSSCEVLIKLFATFKAGDGSKTGINNYHEGAGVNYLFLTGSDSPSYIYNRCTKQIFTYFSGDFKLWLSEVDGFVQISVSGPNGEYTIEDGKLAVDGSTSGWLGCSNTNDPYNYSKSLRQLAHEGTKFNDCTPIWVYAEIAE